MAPRVRVGRHRSVDGASQVAGAFWAEAGGGMRHPWGQCGHSPGQQSPRLRATVQVWLAVPTAPPVLPSQPSSEAPSSRKPSQTPSPRLLSSQTDCHILANTGVRVGVPAPPISHCPQLLSSRADTRTRLSRRRGRPGAVHSPPWPTRPGDQSPSGWDSPSSCYIPSRRGSLWPGRHTARWWTAR